MCKFFKTKACKYGAKGTGCSYSHPPKCMKFLKHGNKKNGGCKKGNKCERYHPKLCFSSLNPNWCDKKKCSFHHLPGTKWSPDNLQTDEMLDHESYVTAATRGPGKFSAPALKRINESVSRAKMVNKDCFNSRSDEQNPTDGASIIENFTEGRCPPCSRG